MSKIAGGGDIEEGIVSEKTPLVPQEGEEEEKDDEKLGEIPENTTKELIITGLAVVTGGCSIVSMCIYGSMLVTASGVLGIGVPAYSCIQEQKITEIQAMKETAEALDRELNILKAENERLSNITGQMESSVKNLNDMEKTLEHLRESETQSLDLLEEQLRESQAILDSMETSAQSSIVQNIISVVLAVDEDGDYSLNDAEIEQLIAKVESTQGVDVNDAMIRKIIVEKGRNINGIMELIRTALEDDEDKPWEEKCFRFESDKK